MTLRLLGPCMMHQTNPPPTPPVTSRRRALWLFLLLSVPCILWLGQDSLLPRVVRFALPRLAESAGYQLEFSQARARFFQPVTLHGVALRDGRGTDLRAAQVEFDLAGILDLFRRPRRWVERVTLRSLSGRIERAPFSCAPSSSVAPRGAAARARA